MIILPPMTPRPGNSSVKAPPRKLLPAVAFDLLMTGLGVYAMMETDEPLWLAGMVAIGVLPILWVVFSAAREQQRAGQGRPIVEDARGRR